MTSQAIFQGTFVKYEDGFVYVKLMDGTIRKFPKAMGASETIGYVQNRISKFPDRMARPQVSQDKKLLIDLTVDDLAQGPLSQWTNKGALGGAFHAMNTPPNVTEVAGRKCVYFDPALGGPDGFPGDGRGLLYPQRTRQPEAFHRYRMAL